ncbi:MAG: 2,4-dihydroxyhept-2-ene-1,7-dioic acid aldolase [Bacteroidia bacterium]|nr:2,4-dihydroxyhept-2-ene-1,7-dioic acid aldolase [Bacteroidia bacterium]
MNLKQRIRNRQLTLGSWLTIPNSSVVEVMASAGFEWLTIDIEHSAIDILTVQNLIRSIQGCELKALVRVYANDEIIIKRVLDAGADGIIVPMIKTKEQAEQLLDWIYYPPKGKRGVGLNRAQNYGIGFEEYQQKLEKEIIVVAQIEHIEAINNLEQILSVNGIDATIIGPYDLSASMGKPGKFNENDVQKAIEKYDLICDKLNKPKGSHVISSNHIETKKKIELGYSFLAFSIDFFFLGDLARTEMQKLKS